MPKIKIDAHLYKRAKEVSEATGYSSLEEFAAHLIEQALAKHETEKEADEKVVTDRLRGLGYID